MTERKFAVVTTVDVVRKTYAIPVDELQKLNEEAPFDIKWAADCVVCGEVNAIVENIADEVVLNVDEMTFDVLAQHLDIVDEDDKSILQVAVDNWQNND